jgi:hypothetical protein
VGRERALDGSVCTWKAAAAASGGKEKARKAAAKRRREVVLLLVVTEAAVTGRVGEGDEEDAVSNGE